MIEKKFTVFDYMLYRDACLFFDAAQLIGDYRKEIPYYVNLAFSIELFLKAFEVKHTININDKDNFRIVEHQVTQIHGHHLLKIFETLNPELQKHLTQLYKNKYRDDAKGDLADLKKNLLSISTVFEDFRYLYPKDGDVKRKRPITFAETTIERIALFLKEFIKEIRPDTNPSS